MVQGTSQDTLWDVIVIGAGPAGSSAANVLAKEGFKVLILDKSSFPRDKICGDGLIPDSIRCLKRLKLYDKVRSHAYAAPSVTIYSPSMEHLELKSEFLVIRRKELDNLLLEAAINNGATFLHEQALDCSEDRDSVKIQTNSREIRGKYVVIATGANIGLLRKSNANISYKAGAVAIRGYLQSKSEINSLIVSLAKVPSPFRSSYAWLFPMKNNVFNVGYGVFLPPSVKKQPNLKHALDDFLKNHPVAKEIASHGEFIEPPKGSILRTGLSAPLFKHERILSIGETMATTFPLTGEGIGKAMETGLLASEVIQKALKTRENHDIYNFHDHVKRKLLGHYTGYHLAETWSNRSWFTDYIIKKANKSPEFKKVIEDLLDENFDYGSLSKWKVAFNFFYYATLGSPKPAKAKLETK